MTKIQTVIMLMLYAAFGAYMMIACAASTP